MAGSLSYTAALEEYQQEADTLLAELRSGVEAAAWRFKWGHPRFRDRTLADVRDATLEMSDAQCVVAQEYAFDTWADLTDFTHAVVSDREVAAFESAVEAIVSGDVPALRSILGQRPELVRARSSRRHHSTLLHYLGANGVEGGRQRTPVQAVEIMKILLDGGADPDALADLYEQKCTTMSMIVSSAHPAQAGLQVALAETLLDYGAAFDGPGSKWQSAVLTALAFGYRETAETLAKRGPLNSLLVAAGLGRTADVERLLPASDSETRHIALALAAQHGNAEIVQLLLDAGEDPSRYNPDGYHAHSTPLHQAVWSGHLDVVRLLVERGARLDLEDTIYLGTPLDWAVYGGRTEIADYLRTKA